MTIKTISIPYKVGFYAGAVAGAKKALMDAMTICAEKKTPWDCIQELAAAYDTLPKERNT